MEGRGGERKGKEEGNVEGKATRREGRGAERDRQRMIKTERKERENKSSPQGSGRMVT